MNLQGFSSEAFEYLQEMAQRYGPNSPGILYQYRNEELPGRAMPSSD